MQASSRYSKMAPPLDAERRGLVESMLDKGFDNRTIKSEALCSIRAVQRIRRERETPRRPTTTRSHAGRRSRITAPMQAALRNILTEQPDLYRDELVEYFYREFGRRVSERSIGRALHSIGWTRKTIRRIAQQRDDDLRDLYLHTIAQYKSYQLVFVDESGCDRRAGYRRWGWSPKGTTPVQVARFGRGKRWHILPAYAQDGIMLRRVYQGVTDSDVFEDFIARLLQHCGRFPAPKSVIVMDNASWHHSERILEMAREAAVIILFLPPYSPDFKPDRRKIRSAQAIHQKALV